MGGSLRTLSPERGYDALHGLSAAGPGKALNGRLHVVSPFQGFILPMATVLFGVTRLVR